MSRTLVDDGGTDTLDASACSVAAAIDLRAGYASSVGMTADGMAASGDLLIAVGSTIENAVGTAFNDSITGNALGNRLEGGGGNDLIDGQGGVDWAVFRAAAASYDVYQASYGGKWTVAARDGASGVDELTSIERIAFTDKAIALDLGSTDSAGQAALLMGAVLGRNLMLAKRELMGSVIDLFDQGYSLPVLAGAIMRLPGIDGVWDALAGGHQATDIARYLYTQVNGTAPDAATLAAGVSSLGSGVQGAYLAQLAVSNANQLQVGLVGLAGTGLEFIAPTGG
jgi:serralysin